MYFSEVFCGESGEVLKENDTIKFPRLAQTYRKIAEEGANAFYQGELAQDLVRDIQAAGTVFFLTVSLELEKLLFFVCPTLLTPEDLDSQTSYGVNFSNNKFPLLWFIEEEKGNIFIYF